VDAPGAPDPHEILGVPRQASGAEVTAAFRRLAKRWHPDVAAGRVRAGDQMALINTAYAALRGGDGGRPDDVLPAPAERAGGLAPALRRALGEELRAALEPSEDVGLVVPTATWASPQSLLAVTDRRLLWLLDDAPVHRVRELPFGDLREVRLRPPRPWRRSAQVAVLDRRGRRTIFGELAPATAAAIARRVRAATPAEGGPTDDRRAG